jgi:hypothetical protein
MAIILKAIYMFNAVPIKIPITFITEIEKYTLKFIWKHKRLNTQVNTEQKEQSWRYYNTQLQTILQAITIKIAWYWHKNIYKDQWNRIEDPDMNPHTYAHLIFDKCAKNIQWRKDSLFNNFCWEK